MKKLISFCLALSMLFGVIPMYILAAEPEKQSMQELITTQQEIDAILAELNEMAAEEKMATILAKENKEMEGKVAVVKAQNDLRKQHLEDRLENLGVNTIDPDDPDDMAALEEVMHGNSGASVKSIPAPPNLAAFADCYTLRQYTGTVTVDGTSYNYSYIYVTDDKGYSGTPLTHSQTVTLVGRESTILQDVLDYQFSFMFSSYLATIPYTWLVDWAIGSVCAALESYNENSIISYSENSDIYNMSMLSVTQMMYIYVYLPIGDWYLCGTKAPNISYTRAEYVVANVGGTAVSGAKSYGTVSSSTGIGASNYVVTYLRSGYHTIDSIGSFTVNAYNDVTIRFTPGFAPYPGQLIG